MRVDFPFRGSRGERGQKMTFRSRLSIDFLVFEIKIHNPRRGESAILGIIVFGHLCLTHPFPLSLIVTSNAYSIARREGLGVSPRKM